MLIRSQKIESFKSVPQSEKPIVLREIAKPKSRAESPQRELRISYVAQDSRKTREVNIASLFLVPVCTILPNFKTEMPTSQEFPFSDIETKIMGYHRVKTRSAGHM